MVALFQLLLFGGFAESGPGLAEFLRSQLAGFDEMGDDGQSPAAEEGDQVIDHAMLRGGAAHHRSEDMRVAGLAAAAYGLLCFEPVNKML
jgi:hypothetical protein